LRVTEYRFSWQKQTFARNRLQRVRIAINCWKFRWILGFSACEKSIFVKRRLSVQV